MAATWLSPATLSMAPKAAGNADYRGCATNIDVLLIKYAELHKK
jgi:hypothetical protein